MERDRRSFDPPTLKTLLRELAGELFHADSRALRTLRQLLRRPGRLTQLEYQPERERFLRPLKLYFVVNFVFFLLVPLLNTPRFQVFQYSLANFTRDSPRLEALVERQRADLGLAPEIYRERFDASLRYNQPAFVFLTVPALALALVLLRRRPKRLFSEQLVFALHFVTAYLLIVLAALALFRALAALFDLAGWRVDVLGGGLLIGLLLALVVHAGLALRRVDGGGRAWSALKAALLVAAFAGVLAVYALFLFGVTVLALGTGA